jgi:uncharacterized protein
MTIRLFYTIFGLFICSIVNGQTFFEGKLGALRFGLKLQNSPARAWFYVPDQMTYDMPFSKVTIKGDSVLAVFPLNKVQFKGQISTDGQLFTGQWLQNKPTDLKLQRTDKFSFMPNRPQMPTAPFAYQVEDVTYTNADKSITFGGTITYPKTAGKFPTLILISGSGQQDRDESLMGHKSFWVIADHLTRNGYAVLRIDDRMIGETTGELGTSADYAQDVLAGIEFLKKRKEVNPKKIGLLGHSEGGMIAPLAATLSKDVAFVVSLAGLGITGKEVVLRQNDDGLRLSNTNQQVRQLYQDLNKKIFNLIEVSPIESNITDTLSKTFEGWLKSQTTENLAAMGMNTAAVQNNYRRQFPQMTSKWYRYFIKYDPKTALEKLKVPILALNGDKDIQVSAKENLEGFAAAALKSGNTRLKTMVYSDLNHLFQHCKTGSVLEYGQIEETISTEVLQTITDWLRGL